jgi:hypothetical protein
MQTRPSSHRPTAGGDLKYRPVVFRRFDSYCFSKFPLLTAMILMALLVLAAWVFGQLALVAGTPLPVAETQLLSQPIVDLGYSQYEGTSLSSGVNQFLGMRYAAPPLGDLRFRAPIDPPMTTGIQSATAVCILFRVLFSYSCL